MGRRVLGFPLKRVGGRGSYGPAPASASLHRLRRRTVLRGTVRPSSCQHVGSGRNGPRSGGVEGFSRQVIHTTPPKPPPSPGGRCSAPENTLEGEGPMVLRRTVRGRRPWSEALAEGGPSIPLPSTRKKRSRHSRPGPPRAYSRPPSSARDTKRPSPITTWSTMEMPTVRPTALSCFVTSRSSADGVGSPEG